VDDCHTIAHKIWKNKNTGWLSLIDPAFVVSIEEG
jgi:hypothetical protein